MAPSKDPSPEPVEGSSAGRGPRDDAAELAKAYQELVKGEQAASALEANLTTLESKLDALLAAFEDPEGAPEAAAALSKMSGAQQGGKAGAAVDGADKTAGGKAADGG